MTLLELRDALRAATGPHWRLDHLIGQYIHGPNIVHETSFGVWSINRRGTHLSPQWETYCAPVYTGSIDAAVTLVPEGLWRETSGPGRYAGQFQWRTMLCRGEKEQVAVAWSATEPLALCLARVEYEIAKAAPT